MFANRLQTRNVLPAAGAAALLVLLAVTAPPGQLGGDIEARNQPLQMKAMRPAMHAPAYCPLPWGKQTELTNAARPACLRQVHQGLAIRRAS